MASTGYSKPAAGRFYFPICRWYIWRSERPCYLYLTFFLLKTHEALNGRSRRKLENHLVQPLVLQMRKEAQGGEVTKQNLTVGHTLGGCCSWIFHPFQDLCPWWTQEWTIIASEVWVESLQSFWKTFPWFPLFLTRRKKPFSHYL
jgi:hypothetical protein